MFDAIYWWHMPLFFIIGGFFIKQIKLERSGIVKFFKTKILPQLKNYFIAGLLLIMLSHFVREESWQHTFNYFYYLIYGGKTLNQYLSIFWFVEVYILTMIAAVLIKSFIKSRALQLTVTVPPMLFAILSNADGLDLFSNKTVPWNAQVVLISTFYMILGNTIFEYLKKIPNSYLPIIIIFITIVYASLIYFQYRKDIHLTLYLKSYQITEPWLAVWVPCLLSILILLFARWISEIKILTIIFSFLGKHTLTIMYMHRAVFDIVDKATTNTSWPELFLGGVIAPIFLAIIYKKSKKKIIQVMPG